MSIHKYCKCGVPQFLHGESCGWLKAKRPIACPQSDEERQWHIKWDEVRKSNIPFINLFVHSEEKTQWETSLVKCDLCNYQWVAVRPEGLVKLECPNCNNMVHFENMIDD